VCVHGGYRLLIKPLGSITPAAKYSRLFTYKAPKKYSKA
jgi:hypothetical protein